MSDHLWMVLCSGVDSTHQLVEHPTRFLELVFLWFDGLMLGYEFLFIYLFFKIWFSL
jgi:hypothetical protein